MNRGPSDRVMVGQVAAVCGLVIAGVSYRMACRIVAITGKRMAPYTPKAYRSNHPPRKWTGKLLDDIEDAWRNPTLATEFICGLFGIHEGNLCKLARRHGWPKRRDVRRSQPSRPRAPKLAQPLPRDSAAPTIEGRR
jgi:hypothetical protein